MTTTNASYANGLPLVTVIFGVSQPRVYHLANHGRSVPPPITCQLLIDSGAEDTYLDLTILQNLHLLPINNVMVQSGAANNQPISYDVYDTTIEIQSSILGQGHFRLASADVISGDFSSHSFDGLLGRDVLRYCDARLNGKTQQIKLIF